MPMFDFVCASCGAKFEELIRNSGTADSPSSPACPTCGHNVAERQMSTPSPLKTGAFPYKPGPVRPMSQGGMSPCAMTNMGGGCGGCGQNAPSGGFS